MWSWMLNCDTCEYNISKEFTLYCGFDKKCRIVNGLPAQTDQVYFTVFWETFLLVLYLLKCKLTVLFEGKNYYYPRCKSEMKCISCSNYILYSYRKYLEGTMAQGRAQDCRSIGGRFESCRGRDFLVIYWYGTQEAIIEPD